MHTIEADAAKELTNKIREGLDGLWDMLVTAYQARVWEVLGYTTWDDYCTSEFGESRIRLPREERESVMQSLREQGLSLRAIASATGYDRRTVARDLAESPAGNKPTPCTVVGLNGKKYRQKKTTADSFWTVSYEMGRLAERVKKLSDSRDFIAQQERIKEDSLPGIIRMRDALTEVIKKLEGAKHDHN